MAVTSKKKVVEVIPTRATEQINGEVVTKKKRVCAYCRVITSNEEQLESYENQVSHYTQYIQNKSEWEYVNVYADEGISGTGTKNRIEFLRMIKEAIEENHEAIIPKEIFDKVQDEKERRALSMGSLVGDRNKYSNKYPFSGKVICGDCGGVFRRRTWNSNNKSKKVVWQCKTYIEKGKAVCTSKSVDEKVLEKAFVNVFNKLKADSEGFVETLSKNIQKVLAKRAENNELIEIENKIEASKEELKALIKLQTKGQMDEEVYNEEYVRFSAELEGLRLEKARIEQGNLSIEQYKQRVAEIIKVISEQEGLLTEFDNNIFNALVEKIEILLPTHFVFVLKNGMRMDMNISIKQEIICKVKASQEASQE